MGECNWSAAVYVQFSNMPFTLTFIDMRFIIVISMNFEVYNERSKYMSKKIKIMFLCTGNSCRSQMADGLAKKLGGAGFEIYSAGLEAHGINQRAVKVMGEIGIDISSNTSDIIDSQLLSQMDYAITLCGDAEERCPVVPATVTKYHWPFPDPAQATGTEEEIMDEFRTVRDAIAYRLEEFINQIDQY